MPMVTDQSKTIHYDVHKMPDIHFVKIYIDELNGIQVTASPSRALPKIEKFLHKKKEWIHERWCSLHDDLYVIDELEMKEGQRIPYLGRLYKLHISTTDKDQPDFAFNKGSFHFTYPEEMEKEAVIDHMKRLMNQWLKEKAGVKFNELHSASIAVEEDLHRLGGVGEEQVHLNWRMIQRSKPEIKNIIKQLENRETC
ncbi:YgjP-like metallopeptidase domain-containing protein [Halobacillus yeomjeoni]|uniref:DUF45 domain-containing protein n=1 Tax=Halobacillus yeomjeoni TaxID=311194 RepID=A0A931MTZ9_9BACI|nr:YgjP-like metallopeptidase domain-containing protein [Halobacillus yeomjeoni]MBH0228884.1 DUF45 domain-containing protein [Halobacillus yeomjeoni]